MSKSPEKWVACGSEDTLATWVEDESRKRVCTMRKCEQDWQRAQLIAAAPELLSAMQALVELADDCNKRGLQNHHLDDAINEARAAIAKATGKE